MANTNFTVHNGLTVGPTTIDAATGDITTSGNISVTGSGSFGGLSSNKIYSGSNNVTVGGSTVNIAIASSNIATFSSTGLTLTGNLIVAGNAFYVNTTTITTNDTIAAPAISAGTIGNSGAVLYGTLNSSSASQTNITAVGTLGSLTVSGTTNLQGTTNGATINATTLQGGTIGNSGATFSGASATLTGAVQANTYTGVAVYAGTIGNTGAVLYGTLNSSSASQTNITAVGNLTSLNSGAITTTGTLAVNASGGITTNQTTFPLVNATATTINFGGAATTINVGASGGVNFVPTGNAVSNLGSTSSGYWNNVYAVNFLGTSTTAKYADLAERYTSDANYEPGTVVDFGGDAEVTLSNIDSSTGVAGVVSTNPAYMMNSDADGLYIALTGRVPTKVTGPVRKGQMMVSNGDGTARAENNPTMGSVIGKALENFSDGTGVIEVVVGRL